MSLVGKGSKKSNGLNFSLLCLMYPSLHYQGTLLSNKVASLSGHLVIKQGRGRCHGRGRGRGRGSGLRVIVVIALVLVVVVAVSAVLVVVRVVVMGPLK